MSDKAESQIAAAISELEDLAAGPVLYNPRGPQTQEMKAQVARVITLLKQVEIPAKRGPGRPRKVAETT
jgi:hypothetical protein